MHTEYALLHHIGYIVSLLTFRNFLTVETYKQTDQEYLKAENNQHRDAGSTAVGGKLFVANVGDSRAVISIDGKGIY